MRVHSVQPQTPHKHTALKAAGVIATGAAATGAVLYAAKSGKLNPTEGGNKIIETVKAAVKKPADKVLNSKGFQVASQKLGVVKNFFTNKFSSLQMIRAKFNPDLASAADKSAETFNNFVK